MLGNAEDKCFRVCLSAGREAHGHGFLSSRGSCSPGDDRRVQRGRESSDPVTAARSQVWSLLWISLLKYIRKTSWFLLSCSVCVWPAGGGHRPGITETSTYRRPQKSSRLNLWSYLTCGVSQEVTDVRDDFTERQTLRSKPGEPNTNTTWTFVPNMIRWNVTWRVHSHVESWDETEAQSFSGPVVLVFEASHHALPHVLHKQQLRC